nr:MAG TPA: minor tail protein [Bacteriophage sp.]
MANRQTYIELSVKTTKLVNGIRTVLELLQKVEDKVQNINKLKINTIGLNNGTEINTQLEKLNQTLLKVALSTEQINKKFKEMPKETEEGVNDTLKAFTRLQVGITAVMFTYRTFLSLFDKINTYASVETAISNLNIASNKGLGEINSTMTEFLNISTQIPKNTKELIHTTDELVRTGRSYKEALEITKEVAKLSVATGEDLDSTAKTVTKVMVSLGIESHNVKEVLNTLHSTAIQTASSMESISGGMNQVAGSLGAIAQSSGKSGKELEEYKKQLLDVGAVGLGVMNNLGKSASESGTKVKVLFTRLISMEKTARGLFNKDTKDYKLDEKYMKALGTNSNVLNADVLSQLARKDLPLAIELMSKLKVEGIVTGQTLQKMFTQRHALDMEVFLGQVNGNIENIINTVTKGKDYMQDFNAQMYTVNNQLQLFKQNLERGTVDGIDAIKGSFVGLLYVYNKLMEENPNSWFDNIARGTASTMMTLGYLGKQFLTLGVAIGQLKHTLGISLTSFAELGAFLKNGLKIAVTSALGWISALTMGLSWAIFYINKIQTEMVQNALKSTQSLENMKAKLQNLSALRDKGNLLNSNLGEYEVEIKTIVDLSLSNDDLTKKITELVEKSKKYFENKEDYRIQLQLKLDTEKSIDNLKQGLENIKQKRLSMLEGLDAEKLVNTQANMLAPEVNVSDEVKNAKKQKLQIEIEFLIANEKGDNNLQTQLIEKARKLLGNDFKLDVTSAYKDLSNYSKQLVKDFGNMNTQIETNQEQLDKLQPEYENLIKTIEDYSEGATAGQQVTELLINSLNEKWMQQGKYYDLATDRLYSFSKDSAYILEQFDKAMSKKYTIEIDQKSLETAQEKVTQLEYKLKALDTMNINIPIMLDIKQRLQTELANAQENLQDQIIKQYVKENGLDTRSMTGILNELYGANATNSKNLQVRTRFASEFENATRQDYETVRNFEAKAKLINAGRKDLNITESERKAYVNAYTNLENQRKIYKSMTEEELSHQTKKEKKSKKETEYKMEYVKLQERSIALEQSLLLIGKEGLEKEYQQYLNKQKSLKLELDTLKATKDRLTLENKQYIQKGSNETDEAFMSRIKARIEEITAMGTLSGKNGQAIKDEQQELTKVYDSYMSYINKYDNLAINSLEMLSKAIDDVKNKQYEAIDSIIAYKKELYNMNKLSDMDYFSVLADSIDITKLKFEDIKNSIGNLNLSNLSGEMQNAIRDLLNSDGINQEALTLYAKLDITDTQDLEKRLKALQDKKANGLALTQDEEKEMEQLVLQLDIQIKLREKIKELQEKGVSLEQLKLEKIKAQNTVAQKGFSQMSNFMKGSGTGRFGAGLGGLFEGLGNYASSMSEQGKNFLPKEWLSKLSGLGEFFKNINADTQVGSMLTSALGLNNQTSQLFGSLGSLGMSALGMAGPYGMLASTGLSLIGGMLGKKNQKKQGEADKKTEQAKKQYEENTRQLQLVATRLESLNTNLLNLNQSMVSIFSSMPTIDNIARITGGMEKLYGIINVNRDFGSASYMTQESRKTGNWLTGKSTVTWLENHQLSTQALLKEYGFNGGILDMSVKELENFSKWLKSYNKGIENNFKEYAKIVDNYVTSMITIKDMLDKFSYRVTFESFSGFSVSKQEDLVKNLTQIYKDAGVTITEGITQQIKELAQQMSVMVTIMSDVRKDFLTQWKDTGKTAGNSFVSAMKPYVTGLLDNMTQVYFDTVFSNSARRLELQFKNIGDLLFKLKKQGRDLTWNKIATEMRKPFSNVVDLLREAQERTDTFTSALIGLQKVAKEKGMSFSEMSSLNLLTKTQQSMFENFKTAIQSNEVDSALTSVGTLVGNTIGEEMSKRLVDKFLATKLTDLSEQLDKTLRGNMNLNDLSKISQMAMSTGLQLETERRKLTAIRDMFNFNKDINYQNNNNEIKYETGTSQTIINNFYITGQVNAGVVIPQAEVKQFVQATINDTIEVLKTDKGIDLGKIR